MRNDLLYILLSCWHKIININGQRDLASLNDNILQNWLNCNEWIIRFHALKVCTIFGNNQGAFTYLSLPPLPFVFDGLW